MTDTSWYVGIGCKLITPDKAVQLGGYYGDRASEGVHDDLYARAFVFSDGRDEIALLSLDFLHLKPEHVAEIRSTIREEYGLAPERVMVCCTHTHTGPDMNRETEYMAWLEWQAADAVGAALKDLSSARIFAGRSEEHGVSFVRRFVMKDGSVVTNPGLLNPEVDRTIGEIDPEVLTLRIASGDRTRAILVNFALHCDTVGGDLVSAGWPFYMAGVIREGVGESVDVAFLQGSAGDINHWNVFKGGHLRGFEEAERIGKIVGAAALQALDNEQEIAPGPVAQAQKHVDLPVVEVAEADYREAKDEMDKPYDSDEDFTMERVLALKRVRAYEYPGDHVSAEMQALRLGEAAVVGLPCEIFNALGRQIKEQSASKPTFVVELANGSIGYIGEAHNVDEGGYEMTSSICAKGSGEMLRDAALELTQDR